MLQKISISQKKTSNIIKGFEAGQMSEIEKFGKVFWLEITATGFVVAF